MMRVLTTIAATQSACKVLRNAGKSIGLVPTMGALHEGHLSLVRAARESCGAIVASIFVNPTQFAPNEDFSKYPRSFEEDCRKLEVEGVDLIFAPIVAEMYPPGASTFVDVEGVSGRLDGIARPGHFRGVATVVAKLFNIVGPDRAFFGQKDAAQVAVLRKMVYDLNFGLELVVCPIVRDMDGLAMSSRNRYLDATQRKQALILSRALREAEGLIASGVCESERILAAMKQVMLQEPAVKPDYVTVVDANTLSPIPDLTGGGLIAVAAYVGTTRLIDNLIVLPNGRLELKN